MTREHPPLPPRAAAPTRPAVDWIECLEAPPAPGWWWFRYGQRGEPLPVEVWKDGAGLDRAGASATLWSEWRPGYQLWPISIALPGAEASARPFEALPRATEQELRAWAAGAEREYRIDARATQWQRGYRHATADVLAILDAAGDEPDPPRYRCAVCGRPCCVPMKCPECGSQEWVDFEADDEPDLERRISEAHTGIGALVTRLDGHDDRLETLQGSTVDAIARVRGVLSDRMDHLGVRLEAVEERLAGAEALLEGLRR